MKSLLVFIFSVLQFIAVSTFANNGKAIGKNKKLKVSMEFQSACATDIEKAGCAGADDGSALMKCLHVYKKSHKEYELSEECKSANLALRKYKKSKNK